MAFGDLLNTPASDYVSSNFSTAALTLNFSSYSPQTGDLILIAHRGWGTLTAPSGFTTLATFDDQTNSANGALYGKISEGNETSANVQQSSSGGTYAEAFVYEGPFGASPFGDSAGEVETSSDSTTTQPGEITTTVADAVVFVWAANNSNSTSEATTISDSFTVQEANIQAPSAGDGFGFAASKVLSETATLNPTITWPVSIRGVACIAEIQGVATYGGDELDVDVYLDNVTSVSTLFQIDSISDTNPQPGDQVTITVSNANATGKTLSCDAGTITIDSQDTTSIVFTVPDPKTFGDRTLWYNVAETLTATDAGYSDTVDITIAPVTGHEYDASIGAVTGMYTYITGIEVGDRAYGQWVSGTGTVDLDNGSLGTDSGGTFRLWVQDATDDVWSSGYIDFTVYGLYPDSTATEVAFDQVQLFVSPALFPEEMTVAATIDVASTSDTTLDINDAATDVYFDAVVSTAYNGFEPEEVAVSVVLENVTSVSGSLLMDIDTDRIRFTG